MAVAQPAVAPDDRGDLALAPYYTVRDDWVTGLHIVNTSDKTQVVKVRFRRATDAMDALDFNLVMSPKDMYAGLLSRAANGDIAWTSPDTTCTAPAAQNKRLQMPAIYRAGAETGYVEIIAMGTPSTERQPIALAAKHRAQSPSTTGASTATLTAPLDCDAVRSNFFADGSGTAAGATTRNGVQNNDTTWQAASSAAAIKTGGRNTYLDSGNVLKVSYFIRDKARGIEFGDNAVHIRNFLTAPAITNQQYGVLSGDLNGFDFPDLNGGVPMSSAGGASIKRARFEALRAPGVLGASAIVNEWSAKPPGLSAAAGGVAMDWVLTLPGQYTMLRLPQYVETLTGAGKPWARTTTRSGSAVQNSKCPRSSTSAECDYRDQPVELSVEAYSREESKAGDTTPELVTSPTSPLTLKKTYLPKVANVVTFGGQRVLGISDADIRVNPGQPYGWVRASLKSVDSDVQVCDWDFKADTQNTGFGASAGAALKNTLRCSPVSGGVPVIGFAAWSRHTAANPAASYGRIVEHSYERNRVASGTVFRDPLKDGGMGPEMVVLPSAPAPTTARSASKPSQAGRFRMGNLSDDVCGPLSACEDERPVRTVTIRRAIAMGKYEVTFADYDRFAEATGRPRPRDWGWGRGARPVIGVSRIDAQAYALWLSAQTGKRYRLPTEAEWEYAARAGTTTRYSRGNRIACSEARYGHRPGGKCGNGLDGPTAVGSFAANRFGLYDMHGNVWEWVEDCYVNTYSGAPSDGSARTTGCSSSPRAVMRGGSWVNYPGWLRSAVRNWSTPSGRYYDLGFRLAQDIGPARTEPVSAPGAPANFRVSRGDAQATATWNEVSGLPMAGGRITYNLYYARQSFAGGNPSAVYSGLPGGTRIAGLTATSYKVAGLANGTPYYFVVTAANTAGEGEASAEASVTPQVPAPGAPTGLTLTAGNAQVTATWPTVTGATGYTLYYATTNLDPDNLTGIESLAINNGATTTGTVTGLNNGTLYYFAVTATNAGGESPASAQDSVTPQVPAPGAPTGLSLTAGDKQVTINWSGVSGASSYILYYRATNSLATLNDAKLDDTSDTSITRVTISSGTSRTIDGLTNGTTYYFRVKAVNAGGRSAASGEGSATPQMPAPGAPTGLKLSAGDKQVTATWEAVTGATGYTLYYATTKLDPDNLIDIESLAINNGATTTGTVSKLTNGTLYHFAVTATNDGGESRASTQASATPQVPAPGAPTGFSLTAGEGQATASWTQVTGASSYILYYAESSFGGDDPTTKSGVRTVPDITTTSRTIGGLTNGTRYYFVVRAVNAGGQGIASGEASVVPIAAPADLSLTAGDAQVAATWSAASGASSYTLYYATTPLAGATDLDTRASGITRVTGLTGTSRTVTGLTNGTTYYFVVRAENSLGQKSAASAQASAIPLATPSGLSLTASNAQVAASWSTAIGASSYTLYHATTPLAGATDLDTRASGITRVTGLTGTSHPVTGLTNGTTYYFRVRAVNASGQSAASAQASAIPLATPSGLSLTASNAQVAASWSAVSGASTYTLYYAQSSLAGATDLDTRATGITRVRNISGTSQRVTRLTNGATYYFVVRAVNAAGQSAASAEVSATPLTKGTILRDTLKDGSQGPEMVVLPTGSFSMGSPATEAGRYGNEGPVRRVTIGKRIAIGRYEATFADYERFADATASVDQPGDAGWGRGTRPVVNVNWNDVRTYAAWLSAQTGKTYRLPTEAEWEYAARAGTTTRYSFGDNIACSQANYGRGIGTRRDPSPCNRSSNPNLIRTMIVGSFAANPFGLYDMHGNVSELVEDCYGHTYTGAPTDGSVRTTGCSAGNAVQRGGGFASDPRWLRSAYRLRSTPSTRASSLGFRLVRDISPSPTAPAGLGISIGNAQVTVSWQAIGGLAAAGGRMRYNLYYAQESFAGLGNPPSGYSTLRGGTKVSNITGTSHTLTSLANDSQYYFVVTAENAGGEGAASAEISGTPAPTVGTVFRDTLKDGSRGPEMVVLPTGSFRMGSPATEWPRDSDEEPVRTVTIGKRIAMGKYEVTFAEYDRFVDATGRTRPDNDDNGWGRGTRPVIKVSWFEAIAYARWLSAQTGKTYRLPTEAEWEYAARAGTTTRYSWGDTITCGRASYGRLIRGSCNTSRNTSLGTMVVGRFAANFFGLHDMHGNVREWVHDCYADTYTNAPTDGSAPRTSGFCPTPVIRDGSWGDEPWRLRSARRSQSATSGLRNSLVGFRLVQDLTAPTNFQVTPGNAQVTATWQAASNASKYNLYYSRNSFSRSLSRGTKVSNLTGTSHTVTGLANRVTYYFVLTAEDASGKEGAASTEFSVTPLAPPATPRGLRLTPGNNEVTAKWNWWPDNGASSYILYYATSSLAGATDLDTRATGITRVRNITNTSQRVTGLTNGTRYYFVVRGVNANGQSGPVSAEASVIPQVPAPTNLRLTAGNTQATASWSAVGGASSYTLYYAESSLAGATDLDTRSTGITRVRNITGTSQRVTGLTNGTTYYFVVRAVNADGQQSAASVEVSVTPQVSLSVPAAPTGLTLRDGFYEITASWQAVSGASTYNLYYAPFSLEGVTDLATRAGVTRVRNLTGTSHPFPYLSRSGNFSVYVVVTAVNAAGESAASAQASIGIPSID